MRKLLQTASCLAVSVISALGSGRLLPERVVHSSSLGEDRTVRIFLPASYDVQTSRKYPVLYVHDGQNVFTSAGPGAAFGWGNWELDATIDRLVRAGETREVLVVAIDNGANRYQDYCGPTPQPRGGIRPRQNPKPFLSRGTTRYEKYASFLADELKPSIDREFRTLKGPSTTGLLGSSLGGICSLAVAWDRPKAFGLVGCMSGAFQVEDAYFLNQVLRRYRGKPKPIRIYLDSGVVDHAGDDDGKENAIRVAGELRRIGWRARLRHYVDDAVLTPDQRSSLGLQGDKWEEAGRSQHNELYWRLRVHRPLEFLFPPVRPRR